LRHSVYNNVVVAVVVVVVVVELVADRCSFLARWNELRNTFPPPVLPTMSTPPGTCSSSTRTWRKVRRLVSVSLSINIDDGQHATTVQTPPTLAVLPRILAANPIPPRRRGPKNTNFCTPFISVHNTFDLAYRYCIREFLISKIILKSFNWCLVLKDLLMPLILVYSVELLLICLLCVLCVCVCIYLYEQLIVPLAFLGTLSIYAYSFVLLARDSINMCLARYMLSPVRLSVRPSVTRANHTKTVEVSIKKFSPYG